MRNAKKKNLKERIWKEDVCNPRVQLPIFVNFDFVKFGNAKLLGDLKGYTYLRKFGNQYRIQRLLT